MPCFARGSGVIVICSEITDCGKSEQNLASCYYLLVVKLVVIENGLLLRVFNYFLIVGIFVPEMDFRQIYFLQLLPCLVESFSHVE